MFVALISAALLLAAADAPPQPAATPAAPQAAVAAKAKPKNKDLEMVCWQEEPTGSHFSKRVCATRIERERMERQGAAVISGERHSSAAGGPFGH